MRGLRESLPLFAADQTNDEQRSSSDGEIKRIPCFVARKAQKENTMYRHPVSKSFSADAFRAPAGQHAPIYSWVWNAKLSYEQTDAQLDEMQRLGIRAFYIIPEPT